MKEFAQVIKDLLGREDVASRENILHSTNPDLNGEIDEYET